MGRCRSLGEASAAKTRLGSLIIWRFADVRLQRRGGADGRAKLQNIRSSAAPVARRVGTSLLSSGRYASFLTSLSGGREELRRERVRREQLRRPLVRVHPCSITQTALAAGDDLIWAAPFCAHDSEQLSPNQLDYVRAEARGGCCLDFMIVPVATHCLARPPRQPLVQLRASPELSRRRLRAGSARLSSAWFGPSRGS